MKLDRAVKLGNIMVKRISDSYTVIAGNRFSSLGTTFYNRHVIELHPLIEQLSYQETKKVILHEIAHMLTPYHGHDYTWKIVSKNIGGEDVVVYNKPLKRIYKYKGVCQVCGEVFYRNSYKSGWQHISDKGKIVWQRQVNHNVLQ